MGGNIEHLGVDALPHLHRPGADADAAVGVDVDQGRGLVEEGAGERDPKAHRHHGDAPLDQGVRAIELRDLVIERGDVVSLEHFVECPSSVALLSVLAVGKGLALADEVGLLDDLGRDLHDLGRPGNGGLDHEHRLRRAEAAKCGEGRQVGAAAESGDADVGDEVAAGRVKEAALEDGG